MKHTPGPWHVIHDYPEYTIDSKLHNIASCSPHPPGYEQNARLIAAAPELLEALTMAVSVIQDNNLDESMAGEFEILTDAIAKATA